MIHRIPQPTDPRIAPLLAMKGLVPVPQFDREEREDRRLLRRITIREAVRDER